jgi:lipopolysaccharide/colanic/teichoic acid biosynthesis glycosyltransferase
VRPETDRHGLYGRRGKRWLDVAASAGALVVLAPLLALVAASVRVSLGGPVLFRQRRPGRNGVPFTLIKFRTMTMERHADGTDLPDAARLTRLGRFLRSTSLDELPELWNVLRGDMSLVGPRPLLTRYLARYTADEARRHEVRPGITGWAQVNGRNALSWTDRFAMDVWYVDNFSVGLDLRILALTVQKVFRREGISGAGAVTMTEFMGSRPADGLST